MLKFRPVNFSSSGCNELSHEKNLKRTNMSGSIQLQTGAPNRLSLSKYKLKQKKKNKYTIHLITFQKIFLPLLHSEIYTTINIYRYISRRKKNCNYYQCLNRLMILNLPTQTRHFQSLSHTMNSLR